MLNPRILLSVLMLLVFTVATSAEDLRKLTQRAEAGDAASQERLGHMYYDGHDVEQDYKEAMKWFRLAADQGFASSQDLVGYMYLNGHGVEQDYKEAMKWFRLAADQGSAYSQHNLGAVYHLGHGVAMDDDEALQWYRLAADQGDDDAKKAITKMNLASRNDIVSIKGVNIAMPQDKVQAVLESRGYTCENTGGGLSLFIASFDYFGEAVNCENGDASV